MARHDRAYLREQRDRIINKRIKFLRGYNDGYLYERYATRRNALAVKHPLDCGNPRCCVCHLDDPSRRAREDRQWKGIVDRAY